MNGQLMIGPDLRPAGRWALRHVELILYYVAVAAIIALNVRYTLPGLLHHLEHLRYPSCAKVPHNYIGICRRGQG